MSADPLPPFFHRRLQFLQYSPLLFWLSTQLSHHLSYHLIFICCPIIQSARSLKKIKFLPQIKNTRSHHRRVEIRLGPRQVLLLYISTCLWYKPVSPECRSSFLWTRWNTRRGRGGSSSRAGNNNIITTTTNRPRRSLIFVGPLPIASSRDSHLASLVGPWSSRSTSLETTVVISSHLISSSNSGQKRPLGMDRWCPTSNWCEPRMIPSWVEIK